MFISDLSLLRFAHPLRLSGQNVDPFLHSIETTASAAAGALPSIDNCLKCLDTLRSSFLDIVSLLENKAISHNQGFTGDHIPFRSDGSIQIVVHGRHSLGSIAFLQELALEHVVDVLETLRTTVKALRVLRERLMLLDPATRVGLRNVPVVKVERVCASMATRRNVVKQAKADI